MKDYALCLDYKYISGESQYYINKHEIRDRILPFSVAVSVIEGEYFVDFDDGTKVSVKSGETIFIQSFIKHSVRMENTGKLTYAHFLCSYVTIDIFNFANAKYIITDSKEILGLLDKLTCMAYNSLIANKLHLDKILCEIFLLLFDLNLISSEEPITEPWLNNTIKYIQLNFLRGITVEEVISVSGYSKAVFYRKFKNRMKISPREYIENERFKMATMLLLEGKKVKDVAKTVGFNDTSYFNKVFKWKYGITPTEYKQKTDYSKG